MKIYAKDIDSTKFWDKIAQKYDSELSNGYHAHRLAMIRKLYSGYKFKGRQCLDFGCGNGVTVLEFLEKGATCYGVDVSKELISLAKRELAKNGYDKNLVKVGGVRLLSKLSPKSLDMITSFNVLAYLTDKEVNLFYKYAYRILKPGGELIITHSNELFDMYSLNSYTVEFFAKHFYSGDKKSIKQLVSKHNAPEITTYNVRENPLNYKFKLKKYGFEEIQQEFYHLHKRAPSLLKDKNIFPDTLHYSEEDKWKLMFMCSAFGSRSVKKK
jgi:ubiquinone/menaquinone biosynthesis C-methylase UbiE